MEKIVQLSVPKYTHIKDTFQIFDARVKRLDGQINVNTKYFNRMKEIRTRVHKHLKSHKLYNKLDSMIIRKSDPIYGDIPDETLELLDKLSKPRKKDLKETLLKVNQMIRAITSDYYYQLNKLKLKRYAELMEYRKNICCLLDGRKFPTDIQSCHRFAPCEKKIVNIWEIPTGDKPYSRLLKIDFDETSLKLARPQYLCIRSSIAFFMRLKYYYLQKASEKGRWSDMELRQISIIIDNIDKKLNHLQQLEQTVKRSSLYNDEAIPEHNTEKKLIVKYTNDLELPKRKRLEDALKTYQLYIAEIQKRMEYRNRQFGLTDSRIQPLIQRIERNIMFTQRLLDILPEEAVHCPTEDYVNDNGQKKILYSTRDESGRIINYNFDETTNDLAFPKLGNLEVALEANKNVLEKFENDMKNIKRVMESKAQEESKNESEDNEENEDNDETQEQSQNNNKGDKYQLLKERINRLKALIQQKKETIEYLQSVLPEPGIRSTFYHHKLCFSEEKRKSIPSIYKAKNPHTPISTSKASKKFLESSFNSYFKWIEQKRNDIKYRNEIESILNNQNTSENSNPNDENQENEDENGSPKQQKILSHTQRMIQNKLKLETYLESIKSVNIDDIHVQTHAKFEKLLKRMKSKSLGPFNKERMIELATPKRTLLKFSIVRFRHLMSENKRRRLECRLSRNLSRPEQIESELRQKESQKIVKIHKKPKTTEQAALNQLFKRILNSDSLSKENSIDFDYIIRYSIMNGFQMF
ncbi:uncharacterized protein MCAP_0864-like [Chironomus tepperi]|uniref:uncharacterized protein MCAP_0864-like n=1 Tax=Chironomus tepperi TaxID=113505 RepID=UPI00391FAEB1